MNALTTLCQLIQETRSLTSVDFSECKLSNTIILQLINALQSNSNLIKVNLSNKLIEFHEILTIFDLVSSGKLTSNVEVTLHSIDFVLAHIRYDGEIGNDDLISLLKALKSNVPIKRVECRGLRNPSIDGVIALFDLFSNNHSAVDFDFSINLIPSEITVDGTELCALFNALKANVIIKGVDSRVLKNQNLQGIITLFEFLSVNNSVMRIDVSPHFIDIEKGIFCFSPESSTQITATELSSLQCLLQSFNVKEFALNKCLFTDETVSILYDLIEVNNSLTSVDFSDCKISKSKILQLIHAFHSKPKCIKVNLSNTLIDFQNLLTIAELVSTHKLTPNVVVSPHSLDFSLGCIRYDNEVTNEDLISLLKALESNVSIKRVDCRGLNSPSVEGVITLFVIFSNFESMVSLGFVPNLICGETMTSSSMLISLLNALNSNAIIKGVDSRVLKNQNLQGLIALFEFLSANKSFKRIDVSPNFIDIEKGIFCFSPESSTQITAEEVSSLQSLLECISIKELTIKQCIFTDTAITALCDSIKNNSSLSSVEFSECRISNDMTRIRCFHLCCSSKQENTTIKFKELLAVFCLFQHIIRCSACALMIIKSILIAVLSVSITGFLNVDIYELLKLLKSNVPIDRVECLGLRKPTLKSLLVLLEIRSIKKSLIDLDVYPHIIDVDNGVFCFPTPQYSTKIHPREIASLNRFCIKEFTLKKYTFTEACFIAFCNLIKVNQLLTFIDLSDCNLSNENVSKLINALQSNFRLKTIILNNNSIEFQCLLTMMEMISTKQLPANIQVVPHSIDVRNGVFCFSPNKFTHMHMTVQDVSSLKSLMKGFSIKELSLKRCAFTQDAITVLCDLIKANKDLTCVDFSYIKMCQPISSLQDSSGGCDYYSSIGQLSDINFLKLISTLHYSCNLQKVDFRHASIGLNSLLTIFELVSTNKFISNIDIAPHVINTKNGVLGFSPEWLTVITAEEVSSLDTFLNCFGVKHLKLKNCNFVNESLILLCDLVSTNIALTSVDLHFCRLSNDINFFRSCHCNSSLKQLSVNGSPHHLQQLDIKCKVSTSSKRFKCRGLRDLTFKGLVYLFIIRSIDKSVTDLLPQHVDVENGVYCFSPSRTSAKISHREISYLKCLCIRKLSLLNCNFTDSGVVALCDLLKVSKFLISVDLRGSNLSNDNCSKLSDALRSNSSLTAVGLIN
ncbi:hypothetical protein GEMRC1_009738 [Eukaryota sp. GEM-RC1]